MGRGKEKFKRAKGGERATAAVGVKGKLAEYSEDTRGVVHVGARADLFMLFRCGRTGSVTVPSPPPPLPPPKRLA